MIERENDPGWAFIDWSERMREELVAMVFKPALEDPARFKKLLDEWFSPAVQRACRLAMMRGDFGVLRASDRPDTIIDTAIKAGNMEALKVLLATAPVSNAYSPDKMMWDCPSEHRPALDRIYQDWAATAIIKDECIVSHPAWETHIAYMHEFESQLPMNKKEKDKIYTAALQFLDEAEKAAVINPAEAKTEPPSLHL